MFILKFKDFQGLSRRVRTHGQSVLCLQLHLDEAISLAYESKPLIPAIRAIPEVARLIPTLVPVFVCMTMIEMSGFMKLYFSLCSQDVRSRRTCSSVHDCHCASYRQPRRNVLLRVRCHFRRGYDPVRQQQLLL